MASPITSLLCCSHQPASRSTCVLYCHVRKNSAGSGHKPSASPIASKQVMLCAGIKESVNMSHIKMHYYTSHPKLNHYAVIPKGLEGTGKEWYGDPHNRDRLPADK